MVFILSFIIIFVFFITSFRAEVLKSNVRLDLDSINLITPLAFLSTLGVLGVVSNTSYYLNIPVERHIHIIYLIALVFLPFVWNRKRLLKIKFKIVQFILIEKLLLLIIFYMAFLYLHRAFAPWSDLDEIVTYGYRVKLIANGFTFSDGIVRGWPVFGECISSYFYFISNTTILPKIIKILGLFFLAQLIYFITENLTNNRALSMAAALLLLVTPEFSYIASSLKTDNVLMLFEGSSLLCMIYLYFKKDSIEIGFLKKCSIITIIFSVISFSIRFSAVYSLILISITLFLLITNKEFKQGISVVITTSIISTLLLVGYIVNFSLYKNPFYPVGGFWTELIPDSNSQIGWDIDGARLRYNMILDNKLLEYLYVPIYISFGLGTTLFDWIPWIIHPVSKGVSLGWANPILSFMFLIVILSYENKKLFFLSFCYLGLYTFWFSGIQYSRVFLGTTVLAIVLYILAINYEYETKVFIFIRKISVLFFISILLIFPIYHALYTFVRMPNAFLSGFSENDRYDSNMKYSKFVSESLGLKFNYNFPLNVRQIQLVDEALEKINKPIILTTIEGYPHIFFKYGVFTNNKLAKYHCVLSQKSFLEKKSRNLQNILDFNIYGLWC